MWPTTSVTCTLYTAGWADTKPGEAILSDRNKFHLATQYSHQSLPAPHRYWIVGYLPTNF